MSFILNVALETLFHTSTCFQGFSGMGIIQPDPFFRKAILNVAG